MENSLADYWFKLGNTVLVRRNPHLFFQLEKLKIPTPGNPLPCDTDGDFATIARLNRAELPQLGKRTVADEAPPETFHLAI